VPVLEALPFVAAILERLPKVISGSRGGQPIRLEELPTDPKGNRRIRPEGPTDTSRGLQPRDHDEQECAAKSAPETEKSPCASALSTKFKIITKVMLADHF